MCHEFYIDFGAEEIQYIHERATETHRYYGIKFTVLGKEIKVIVFSKTKRI